MAQDRECPYLAVIFEGIRRGSEVRDDLLTVRAPWVRKDSITEGDLKVEELGPLSETLDSPFREPLLTLSGFKH